MIADKSFKGHRVAAITLAAIFVFQVCCFVQFPAATAPMATPASDSSCHNEMPTAPESPIPPIQSHSCCAPAHSQDAVAAAVYTPPQITATWSGADTARPQTSSLNFVAAIYAKSTGPPGVLALRI